MGPNYSYPGGTSEGFHELRVKPDIPLQILENWEDAQEKKEGDDEERVPMAARFKNESSKEKVLAWEESAEEGGVPAPQLTGEKNAEDAGVPAPHLTGEGSAEDSGLPAAQLMSEE
ncbi:hypothetical protein NDU88_002104 [Pleurodeles waltl]|uniref:Uncharacterized protein n=1 Tax=Pleurodeles waltl TaxID=8319 RepID=A0AAV7SCS5_PLEWA|nr:hypothetical protein NDU88_002104 [Pleurodeles waltl]